MFTVKQVAGRAQVSEKTIRRLIERGELSHHRIGRQIRIAEDDLIAFLGKRRQA